MSMNHLSCRLHYHRYVENNGHDCEELLSELEADVAKQHQATSAGWKLMLPKNCQLMLPDVVIPRAMQVNAATAALTCIARGI